MKKENKSFSTYIVAGIFTGVLSSIIKDSRIGLAIAILILFILPKILGKMWGEEKAKWWFGNGGFVYIIIWVVSWTILYNLGV